MSGQVLIQYWMTSLMCRTKHHWKSQLVPHDLRTPGRTHEIWKWNRLQTDYQIISWKLKVSQANNQNSAIPSFRRWTTDFEPSWLSYQKRKELCFLESTHGLGRSSLDRKKGKCFIVLNSFGNINCEVKYHSFKNN